MTAPIIVTMLSAQPLDIVGLIRQIWRDDCGAVVTFEGTTRSPSDGKVVRMLEYEAYEERAAAQLRELANESADSFGLGGVVVVVGLGVPIADPLAHVALHIEQAPVVGLARGDGARLTTVVIQAREVVVRIVVKCYVSGGKSKLRVGKNADRMRQSGQFDLERNGDLFLDFFDLGPFFRVIHQQLRALLF